MADFYRKRRRPAVRTTPACARQLRRPVIKKSFRPHVCQGGYAERKDNGRHAETGTTGKIPWCLSDICLQYYYPIYVRPKYARTHRKGRKLSPPRQCQQQCGRTQRPHRRSSAPRTDAASTDYRRTGYPVDRLVYAASTISIVRRWSSSDMAGGFPSRTAE